MNLSLILHKIYHDINGCIQCNEYNCIKCHKIIINEHQSIITSLISFNNSQSILIKLPLINYNFIRVRFNNFHSPQEFRDNILNYILNNNNDLIIFLTNDKWTKYINVAINFIFNTNNIPKYIHKSNNLNTISNDCITKKQNYQPIQQQPIQQHISQNNNEDYYVINYEDEYEII